MQPVATNMGHGDRDDASLATTRRSCTDCPKHRIQMLNGSVKAISLTTTHPQMLTTENSLETLNGTFGNRDRFTTYMTVPSLESL